MKLFSGLLLWLICLPLQAGVFVRYQDWSANLWQLNLSDLPLEMIDELTLSPMLVTQKGDVIPRDQNLAFQWQDPALPMTGLLPQLAHINQQFEHLSVLISVGGWGVGSEHFSTVVADPIKRQRLVTNLVKLVDQYQLDGIELDWRQPGQGGSDGDGQKGEGSLYNQLINELRQALGSDRRLNVTLPALLFDDAWNPGAIRQQVDRFYVHSWFFHGGWDSLSRHHAALYAPNQDLASPVDQISVYQVMNRAMALGIEAHQLVLTMAPVSLGWQANALNQPHQGMVPSQAAIGEGLLPYPQIRRWLDHSNSEYRWHDDLGAATLYIPENHWLFSLEDPASVRQKVSYAQQQGLAGVAFTDVYADDFDKEPLLMLAIQAWQQGPSWLQTWQYRWRHQPQTLLLALISAALVLLLLALAIALPRHWQQKKRQILEQQHFLQLKAHFQRLHLLALYLNPLLQSNRLIGGPIWHTQQQQSQVLMPIMAHSRLAEGVVTGPLIPCSLGTLLSSFAQMQQQQLAKVDSDAQVLADAVWLLEALRLADNLGGQFERLRLRQQAHHWQLILPLTKELAPNHIEPYRRLVQIQTALQGELIHEPMQLTLMWRQAPHNHAPVGQLSVEHWRQSVTQLMEELGHPNIRVEFPHPVPEAEIASDLPLSMSEQQQLEQLQSQLSHAQQSIKELLKTPHLVQELYVLTANKEQIAYVQAEGGYAQVILKSGKTAEKGLLHMRLRTIQLYFDPCHFVQVHRAFLVNPKAVSQVNPLGRGQYELHILDQRIKIGRKYLPQLKTHFGHWFVI